MAYTGSHDTLDNCLYCKEPRRDARGKPRQTFLYTPLIPRLRAAWANRKRAKLMQYRAHEHQYTPGGPMTDVFDSSLYRDLLETNASIGDESLGHRHFSDPRDIALGLSTDGFAPFKKRKQTT